MELSDRKKAKIVARLWARGEHLEAWLLARYYNMRCIFWR